MKLTPPDQERPARLGDAPIIPMINVVFLLLIFFMMAATLATPAPFEVSPPVSTANDVAARQAILLIAADGTLALGDLRGDALWAAIAPDAPLTIRADAQASAQHLAEALARARALGVGDIRLTVAQR